MSKSSHLIARALGTKTNKPLKLISGSFWFKMVGPTRARTCLAEVESVDAIRGGEPCEELWTQMWTQIQDDFGQDLTFIVESWAELGCDTKAAILAIAKTSLEYRSNVGGF